MSVPPLLCPPTHVDCGRKVRKKVEGEERWEGTREGRREKERKERDEGRMGVCLDCRMMYNNWG